MSPFKYFIESPKKDSHIERNLRGKTKLGTCCVLMPFRDEFKDVYGAIRAAVEGGQVCFKCTRPDDYREGGNIMDQVLQLIESAEVIVADLTTNNPNVFFELGIARTIKEEKKIILITQDNLESLPYDVRGLRVHRYDVSNGLKSLEDDVVNLFEKAGEYSWQFDVKDGESYRKDSKIFGLDNQLYMFELDSVEVGLGGAATFQTIVHRIEDGEKVDTTYSKKTLQEGDKVEIPGLGWTLQLKEVKRTEAELGISRYEAEFGISRYSPSQMAT